MICAYLCVPPARSTRGQVLVMRAESLLSTASAPGTHHDAAAATARKALGLLVKAAGLQVGAQSVA